MKTKHLKMIFLLEVLTEVLMISGESFVGTVGGEVKIRCSYPDKHKYTPKYFCRQRCTSSAQVLISSKKTDQFITNGRYSLYDNVNGRFFTATITNLRLTDSGVYYCGLDQWFRDTLKKVHLSVQPATPANRPSHTMTNTPITSNSYTMTATSAENASSHAQSSSIVQTGKPTSMVETYDTVTVVCAGVLVLLVFGVLVALTSFCSQRSDLKSRSFQPPVTENFVQDSPNPYQTADVVYHVYDEMMIADSGTYSTVQHRDPAPQDDANTLYSLITHYTG